jgi:hypothetical protein
MGVSLILPSHSSGIVIAPCHIATNDCCVINIVIVSLQSMLLLALFAFAIVDVVDPH